jgi:hypothetical protein
MIGKLSALKVGREKGPGLYGDGGGLYLQVTKQGTKSWIFRFWIAERDSTTGALLRDPTTNKVRGRGREINPNFTLTGAEACSVFGRYLMIGPARIKVWEARKIDLCGRWNLHSDPGVRATDFGSVVRGFQSLAQERRRVASALCGTAIAL